jgi:peptide/nickel transport system ATP-binding protein
VPNLLDVSDLATHFLLPQGPIKAVDGVSFTLATGETVALVGESGCGKSVTALSLMRLVAPPGAIVGGSVRFADQELLTLPLAEMRALRGNRISMIFQEPMTSLNPVLQAGFQIAEGLRLHRGMTKTDARDEAVRLLTQVGIPAGAERYHAYPHQLSGGMKQRVMIAMALACQPQLLIADEPTTALDVTIQAQILELIDRLKEETGMSLLLITHDLGIVAERAARTVIMYAGRVIEYAPTPLLFGDPRHPYTQGLLSSLPQNSTPGKPLSTIPGSVPSLEHALPGCGFCDRCPHKNWQCRQERPPLKEVSSGHLVACWKYS